jgi:GT2 family glycosyltransferase
VTLVSAIVVTQRGGPLLDACLASLEIALAPLDAELIVVDNSAEGLDIAAEAPSSTGGPPADSPASASHTAGSLRVLSQGRNLGFAGGVAAGMDAATGEWILLVNDDAELEPGAAVALLGAAGGVAEVGAACGQVRFHARRDVVNTAGLVIDRLGVAYDRLAGGPAVDGGPVETVFGASACVVLYRRAMLDAIGGFDASFFVFGEDADVAWRARTAGWACVYVPASVAYHHGSATAGEASAGKYFLVGRNRMRLLAKNATRGQLVRWGWAMALYDLAYVAFVAVTDRTLAPLRGRVAGLREWRAYRRAGAATRGPAPLAAPTGPLGAWRQRKAYRGSAR